MVIDEVEFSVFSVATSEITVGPVTTVMADSKKEHSCVGRAYIGRTKLCHCNIRLAPLYILLVENVLLRTASGYKVISTLYHPLNPAPQVY